MVSLGPTVLCCGRKYTDCQCAVAQVGDEKYELPVIEPPPKEVFVLGKVYKPPYPGCPEEWHLPQETTDLISKAAAAVRVGGFVIVTEKEKR